MIYAAVFHSKNVITKLESYQYTEVNNRVYKVTVAFCVTVGCFSHSDRKYIFYFPAEGLYP